MTKYSEIQMDKKLRSANLRTENKKQNVSDPEKSERLEFHRAEGHRGDSQRSQKGTKIKCYVKENQTEFSERIW